MLVVDDNNGIRQLLAEVLTSESYSVDTVSNGIQALARIKECLPSVILLDLKMPGMGGMQVLTELNKSYPDLPVVLISAYSDLKDIKEATDSGFIKHFISKPFSLTDLIELLKTLDI